MIPVMRILDGDRIIDINASSFNTYRLSPDMSGNYRLNGHDPERPTMDISRRGAAWSYDLRTGADVVTVPVTFGSICMLSRRLKQAVQFFIIDESFKVSLPAKNGITIGKLNTCTITIPDRHVSKDHARIYYINNEYRIYDQNSGSGTYVNGIQVQTAVLHPGDVISVGTYYFKFDGANITSHIPEKLISDNTRISTRPTFKQSPRIATDMDEEEFQIEPPPSIGSKPNFNITSLLYPIGGVNYLFQGGSYKKRQKLQVKTYNEYIATIEEELKNRQNLQCSILEYNNPSLSTCVEWACDKSSRLWERSYNDTDFLHLRIGCGTVPSMYVLKPPTQQLSLTKNVLVDKAVELSQKSKFIYNAPISCNLNTSSPVGIVGTPADRMKLLNNIVISAAALHSYEELKIAGFMPAKQRQSWQWMRWLPHCFSEDREMRFLAEKHTDASELANVLSDITEKRALDSGDSHFKKIHSPFYLIIIADPNLVSQSSVLDCLSPHDDDLQYTVVYLADSVRELPKECDIIIESEGGRGLIYSSSSAQNKKPFISDSISVQMCDNFSRALAPIRLDNASKAAPMPTFVSFLEGYGVKKPAELDIGTRWSSNKAYASMSVPIGIQSNNEGFYFDIHEKKHGPNGVVAGMIGSGKTEMIQSWILSMAVNFSPQDVSFVLVDFKGTGLLRPFRNLPHVAGTISDLDTNIGRNLLALENELKRREQIFADANMGQDILKYKKAYEQGIVSENMPFLIIVIDEYAEFKKRFPDFTTKIESIFCKGRALGVYMVLMTQRPAGIVTPQMTDNNRFRWCLKVANSEASRDMIKRTDAAKIKNPGRAFVQVGEDEIFEEVQSFFSGAPYRPFAKDSITKTAPIAFIDLLGRRNVYQDSSTTGFQSSKTEIDAIVEYIDTWCDENGIAPAKKVWTKKLPEKVSLREIVRTGFDGQKWTNISEKLCPSVGLVDDPAKQSQYALTLDMSDDGHVIVCGMPGSGKTTFLQTLIMSTAVTYSPEDVQMYLMSFGSWNLGMFKNLPHVGSIANDNEEEKINKLVQLITDELDSRRNKFSFEGVGTLETYRHISGEKLPYIMLVLDNFAPVLSQYPGLDGFFNRITREGGNYGIFLVTTVGAITDIGYKMWNRFQIRIAMQMADKTVYNDLIGKTDGLVPENTEGRGLINLGKVLEFQTALPIDGNNEIEVISNIRNLSQQMNDAWSGNRPKQVAIMPQVIPYGSIPSNDLVIGLYKQDLAPVIAPFTENHCMVISGIEASGKTNLLKVLVKQLTSRGVEVTAFTTKESDFENIRTYLSTLCTDGASMDEYMDVLLPELSNRKSMHDANPDRKFSEIAIIIDDWKQCFDVISNQTAKRLEMVVRLAAGLGVYLVVAEDNRILSTLYNQGEGVISALIGKGTAVLLGDSMKSHTAFESDLSYTEKNIRVDEFEGYLLTNGHALRFKAMKGD